MGERNYILLGSLAITTCLFLVTMILGILAYTSEGGKSKSTLQSTGMIRSFLHYIRFYLMKNSSTDLFSAGIFPRNAGNVTDNYGTQFSPENWVPSFMYIVIYIWTTLSLSYCMFQTTQQLV